jgi:hypothetical protein
LIAEQRREVCIQGFVYDESKGAIPVVLNQQRDGVRKIVTLHCRQRNQ